MSRPIHLSGTGAGYGASPDAGYASELANVDLQNNLRVTLCGQPCGTHGHVDEDNVVKWTDFHRRYDLRPGKPEHEFLCTLCVNEARRRKQFGWLVDGKALFSEIPEQRKLIDEWLAEMRARMKCRKCGVVGKIAVVPRTGPKLLPEDPDCFGCRAEVKGGICGERYVDEADLPEPERS